MEGETYGFDYMGGDLVGEVITGREGEEMLMQWGMDKGGLVGHRFRMHGTFNEGEAEYVEVVKALLINPRGMQSLGMTGTPSVPVTVDATELRTSEMSMDFFDRLKGTSILGDTGNIRGCFNEEHDGIQVDDMLRDMFVNPYSDNADMYSDDEKEQLLYVLLRLFVVGGCMNQPDTEATRYLTATRDLYKSLLTVFKSDTDGAVTVAGKVFDVRGLEGAELFQTDDARNRMLVLVDPKKNIITVIKNDHKSYW